MFTLHLNLIHKQNLNVVDLTWRLKHFLPWSNTRKGDSSTYAPIEFGSRTSAACKRYAKLFQVCIPLPLLLAFPDRKVSFNVQCPAFVAWIQHVKAPPLLHWCSMNAPHVAFLQKSQIKGFFFSKPFFSILPHYIFIASAFTQHYSKHHRNHKLCSHRSGASQVLQCKKTRKYCHGIYVACTSH